MIQRLYKWFAVFKQRWLGNVFMSFGVSYFSRLTDWKLLGKEGSRVAAAGLKEEFRMVSTEMDGRPRKNGRESIDANCRGGLWKRPSINVQLWTEKRLRWWWSCYVVLYSDTMILCSVFTKFLTNKDCSNHSKVSNICISQV